MAIHKRPPATPAAGETASSVSTTATRTLPSAAAKPEDGEDHAVVPSVVTDTYAASGGNCQAIRVRHPCPEVASGAQPSGEPPVARVWSGEAEAAAYTPLRRLSVGIALRLTGSRAAAEDIAQDVWLKVRSHLPGVPEGRPRNAYVAKATVRLSIDMRKRDQSTITLAPDQLDLVADRESDRLLRLDLDIALERLSSEHRRAVVLHHCVGYKQDEIAMLEGIPSGTASSRICNAMKALRKTMAAGRDDGKDAQG